LTEVSTGSLPPARSRGVAHQFAGTGHEPFAPCEPRKLKTRESVYKFTTCRTLEDLRWATRHTDDILNLSLSGSAANDDVLARVLGSTTMRMPDIEGPLRGRALRAISRLPALEVLRICLTQVEDTKRRAERLRVDGQLRTR
jgi:hypothetical protein